MAGTARGIRVGYEINKEQLHASVLPQTAPFQRCVNVHCTGAECLSSARGNTQSSRKAHCRDSAPHRLRERLLQLFSGAKERRRTPPNLGSETAESRAFEALIQNDYAEANPLTHQTGRLVYLRGFKGCLFSHSGSPPPQDSVPIHGPALRLILAPHTFTKCMDAVLSPLKQSAMRILNYLDDWLVLAQSESALLCDKFRLLAHLQSLGLTVNMQKSMLVPSQNISFLGVELNSINMRAPLSEECSQKLISSLAVFKLGRSPPLKCFQRTLGLGLQTRAPTYATASALANEPGTTERIKVTRDCLHMLTPWRNMTLYRRGVLIGQGIRRKNVTTDASSTGWGALCGGRPAFGTWSEMEKSWHINCLELCAVHLVLECFLPDILHRHVLIRTDSMTVVAFINHQGGVNSRPLLWLARDLLLWAD